MAIGRTLADASLLDELARTLEPGVLRPVFQPVVDLSRDEVIGYEAFARGPLGSRLERPDNLFAAARAANRTADLDWACRAAAARGALEGGLRPPLTLFLNVDQASLHRPVPPAFKELWTRAESRLRVVLDITEQALTDRPTELLWSVEWARDLGWGIALDDVGADPRSLAMLPFLRPDVIKLDLARLRPRPSLETADVVHAVAAEAERTGAVVVAEGVETPAGREAAEAMGASLAQGWLFGRPGPLPRPLPDGIEPLPIRPRGWDVPVAFTPFDVLSAHRPVRRGTKRVLFSLTRALERRASAGGDAPVVLSAFQDERFYTPATNEIYEDLAGRAAFVAALGVGMGPSPGKGVRGAPLFARDPLRGEWVVAVVSPHFAAAVAARDLGDDEPDHDRRFDYAITHNRDLVLQVALGLMVKVIAV
jgi:EAL domain-containing protein (putative c-di-GMP-specific phosphodiesterase class I)